MKKLLVAVAFLLAWPNKPVFAFNVLDDIRNNWVWTAGKTGEVGEAVKIAGQAGNLRNGETTTSFLAGIADYRWFTFSYGGTRINKNTADMTDTLKAGLRLTYFFDWFKNPPTAEMAFLRNVNVGPSLAVPIFSSPHGVALLLDANYRFSGI